MLDTLRGMVIVMAPGATDSDVEMARPSPETCADTDPCGPFSLSVSVPVRSPTAVGVKLKHTVQMVPAASLSGASGQSVPMMVKSPVIDIELMFAILAREPEIKDSPAARPLEVKRGDIRFESIYDEVQ